MVRPKEESLWSNVATRMLVNSISHPLEYAKVLIQIGYEPIPPRPTKTFFGKPAWALPNIFQYVRYIKSIDGFSGCYTGIVPKLSAYAISTIVFEKTSEAIVFDDEPDERIDEDDLPDDERQKKGYYDLIRDVISRVAGIIVSHPLDVIALRTMAQFVGGEKKYTGIIASTIEIYRENGIAGYYAGIIPRVIANVATLVAVSISTYALNKYIVRDYEMKLHTGSIMTFLFTTITYPFHVVSHCMIVNNCGLAAGRPPHMPIYDDWLDCWSHLSSMGQLKRGSSMLWRYYTGPSDLSRNWKGMSIENCKFQGLKVA